MNRTLAYSNSLLERPSELRQKAGAEGVLLFKSVLDPAKLAKVRAAVVEVCRRHGLAREHAGDSKTVLARPGLEIRETDNAAWRSFYTDVLKVRELNAMTQDAALNSLMASLFGKPVLPHARVICRFFANYPDPFATVPHRDYTLNGGSQNTWTCWIPLVEVTPEMGGLRVMPASQETALAVRGKDERSGFVVEEGGLLGPEVYEVGDLICFHSMIIHAGAGNASKDRIRISMECRYQPLDEPVRYDSMEPHWGAHGLGWKGIYSAWPDPDPLKFFWEPLKPQIVQDFTGSKEEDLRRKFLYRQLRDAFKG